MSGKRSRTFLLAALPLVLALAFAPPAWASLSATVAPISSPSSGSYLVTVTNSGAQTPGSIIIGTNGAVVASSVAPSTCTYNQPVAGAIGCPAIAAGGTLQVCYNGSAATEVTVFYAGSPTVVPTAAATVASCPVPGFVLPAVPGAGAGAGAGPTTAAAGTPVTLGKARDNPAKGTAALIVTVPGPGTLELSGKNVKTAMAKPKAAGKVTLTVRATGKAAGKLSKNGSVKVPVSVTFTPTGGAPSTRSTTVKLVKQTGK